MKKSNHASMKFTTSFSLVLLLLGTNSRAQQELTINRNIIVEGYPAPIPVSVSGFPADIESVLKNDLSFMGFEFVAPDKAQYQIVGAYNNRVEGRVLDPISKATVLAKAYTGGTKRNQTHALSDDIALSLTHKPGIAQTKIAFKVETGTSSEIYMSDYDGFNPQALTRDHSIVAAPCWGGKSMIYYTSYKLNNPDVYSHNLATGQRKTVARYTGLNTSVAVSPDGRRLAMILSKDGSPDVYVSDADGGNLRHLTKTREAESSPCWSPDGNTICFVSRVSGAAALYKISANGGEMRRLPTIGTPNPTEPDWSPDGKTIVFTSQMRDFNICIVPAEGGRATVLVTGEDPSWAPNSRAVVFVKRKNYIKSLSLLDVPTKHVKDIARISESNSQPSWAQH